MKLGHLLKRRTDLILFMEAVCWLFFANLTIRLLPFDRIARLLVPKVARRALTAVRRETGLLEVRWAVVAASRRVPWRSVCFHQGIAAQRMLCRRGISAQLNYGIGRNENGLTAHVWVTAGETTVIGGQAAESFIEIATFSSR